jgi:hypothetical protein
MRRNKERENTSELAKIWHNDYMRKRKANWSHRIGSSALTINVRRSLS